MGRVSAVSGNGLLVQLGNKHFGKVGGSLPACNYCLPCSDIMPATACYCLPATAACPCGDVMPATACLRLLRARAAAVHTALHTAAHPALACPSCCPSGLLLHLPLQLPLLLACCCSWGSTEMPDARVPNALPATACYCRSP